MEERDRNIVAKVIGFFSVVMYWIIVSTITTTFQFSDLILFVSPVLYFVVPIAGFIIARRRSKSDLEKRDFYKGVTLGLIVSLVLVVVVPLILLGSCFVLMGAV